MHLNYLSRNLIHVISDYQTCFRLIALVEAGIIKRAKLRDLPLAEVCPVDLRSTERQLTNSDLLLTYKVVIAGYIIALVVFLVELAIRLTANSYKRRKTTGKCCACTFSCCKSKRQPKKVATPELVYITKNRLLDSQISLQKRSVRPLYQNVPHNLVQGKKHCINGRDYYVVIDRGGDQRLIPIRTPSAFLFQYAA